MAQVKRLFEKGVDINQLDDDGWTPLIMASRYGSQEVVKFLLDVGADFNFQNEDGNNTALMFASIFGYVDIVRMLVNIGVDINAQNINGNTAIDNAVDRENEEIVEMLIGAGANVNLFQYLKRSNLFKFLLDLGADPNEIIEEDDFYDLVEVSIIIIATYHKKEEIVKMLIDAGVDVDFRGNSKYTALMVASMREEEEIVEMLIDAGADVNIKNENSDTALSLTSNEEIIDMLIAGGAVETTPLIIAAQNDDLDLALESINDGVDLNFKNRFKLTALMLASLNGFYGIVELLTTFKAKLNLENIRGETALILASKNGHSNVVNLLIDSRSDINIQTKDNDTALILASQNGNVGVVKSLISAGADPNVQNNIKWTALISAAFNDDIEIVENILSAENVDIYIRDNQNFTAEGWAKMYGYEDIVELLSRYHIPIQEWLIQNVSISKRCCKEVIQYTRGGDRRLNAILRGWTEWTERSILLIKDIYKALDEVPGLPEDLPVFRGMHSYGDISYEGLNVKDLLDLNGINSFTTDYDIAIRFGGDGFVLKTFFTGGSKALYLDEDYGTSFFEEKEVITYANMVVKVLNKYIEHVVLEEGEEDVKVIEVEIYDEGEKDLDVILR